jgi:DNA processing protein
MDETLFVSIALSQVKGINRKDRARLIETVAAVADLDALNRAAVAEKTGRLLPKDPDIAGAKQAAEKIVKAASAKGMRMVCYLSPDYPPLLRESYEPPLVLFYRGVLSDPVKPLVGMVGTRRPSSAAQAWAYQCGRELGEAGLGVVSGLALGIDAMSHRGNVDGGGKTVAVLGSAIDEVYPASNRPLAKRILDGGGALVSEYPPGTRPARWTFPERNRIIIGLARGCVVVEAPEKSGALITARYTVENNRDLWISEVGAAPRADKRLEKFGAGTRSLAGQGAKVISGAKVILEEWGLDSRSGCIAEDRGTGHRPVSASPAGRMFSGAGLAETLRKELGL